MTRLEELIAAKGALIVSKINRAGECWLWAGWKNPNGYGQIWTNGHQLMAHRYAYELLVGPIPAGLELDHLCRQPSCVNPDHLEPVTHRENILRSPVAPTAVNARKTHCPQGHPYDKANTRICPDGSRACRACHRQRVLAYGKAKAAAGHTYNCTREKCSPTCKATTHYLPLGARS